MFQTKAQSIIVKAILLSLCIISAMCTGAIAPALPLMAMDYSEYENARFAVRLIVTVPHLMIAIFSPFVGSILDKKDRQKAVILAVAFYAMSGFACYFTRSLTLIICYRIIVGLCVAVILSASSTLIADLFDGKERSSLVGLQTTFMSIGTVTFSLLGGIVADINWRYNFFLYTIPAIFIPFLWIYLFDPKKRSELKKATQTVASVVVPNAVVQIQKNSTIILIYIVSTVNMAMYYMIPLNLPFLLTESDPTMNAKKISIALSLETFSAATFAIFYKKTKEKISYVAITIIAFFVMSSAYFIIGFNPSYSTTIFCMMLYGLGMGTMMPNSTLWIISVTKPHNRGLIIGGLYSAIYSGKFIASLAINWMSKSYSTQDSYRYAASFMLFIAFFVLSFHLYKKYIEKNTIIQS